MVYGDAFYAQYDGITYVGMADHHKLAIGYANAGFYLYPTSYPETGCVALMKAQALGAIPITSRHYDSTLPELVGDFDLGPPMTQRRKSLKIDHDQEWIKDWVQAVINAGKMQPEAIRLHRQQMMSSARQRFFVEHSCWSMASNFRKRWRRRQNRQDLG